MIGLYAFFFFFLSFVFILFFLYFCCKTFPRTQYKIGPCITFVAKYIINVNANFDFSVPVLVGVGEAINPASCIWF